MATRRRSSKKSRRRSSKSKRRSYSFGDYTDDSLDVGSSAVIRASRAGDCTDASEAFDKLRDMGKFITERQPEKTKAVDRAVAYAADSLKKCKRS